MNPLNDLELARKIAKGAGLRITQSRPGVFNLWRDTVPKLTYIGQRVSASALLELVRKAARVEA